MADITKQKVVEQLKGAGVSPSEQRIAVFSFLHQNHIHPTADTIYQRLSPDYPTLSKTTVYNTLKLLVAKCLIQVVAIEDGELRFDVNTDFHAHFKCRECLEVIDLFDIPEPQCPTETQLIAESTQLNFYGICDQCKGKLEEQS